MAVILGLDPGRDKFGWAFVAPDGSLLASGIIPSARAEELVGFLLAGNLEGVSSFTRESPVRIERLDSPGVILLGNGTARQGLAGILVSRKRAFILFDEANTTLEARPLYWFLHPPKGLARFLPESLRVPPRPIDDLAAWVLARRFLAQGEKKAGM